MDAIMLAVGLLLTWLLGIGAVLLLRAPVPAPDAEGEAAWIAGAGGLAGAFLATVWMRVLSAAGIRFGLAAVALPLAIAAVALLALAWRRHGAVLAAAARRAVATPDGLAGAARTIWWIGVAWLALRFVLLGTELASRPLYPWDAWTQWATKARVWYELGYLAPFARVTEWLAANGAVWFDASPEYPPTMPLLQVYACLWLGRWDDALMNWPWWQIGVALALVVYGGLRSLGATAGVALAGTLLAASLPLANVHVALAGYADLPMAAFYTAAAVALLRWAASRDRRDAALALLFAAACTQIKNPGWFWAATLAPGLVVTLLPRRGLKVAGIGFALVAVALVVLARFKFTLFNYRIDATFAAPWGDLAQSFFLLGNWHLLWYAAIVVALVAWRQLLAPALAPLTLTVAAGLTFLFFVFAYTTASAYVSDQTTVNRAALHMAPLVAIFVVLGWQAFARRWVELHPPATPAAPAPLS
ncbi:MAG: hypothetical protein U1F58_10910 [Burkholderiales bacterium]